MLCQGNRYIRLATGQTDDRESIELAAEDGIVRACSWGGKENDKDDNKDRRVKRRALNKSRSAGESQLINDNLF